MSASFMTDFLADFVDKKLEKIEIAFVAKIVSFNKTTLRATIQPQLKTKDEANDLRFPEIQNVPTGILYAGGAYIRPVYVKGDLVFCSCTASNLSKPIDSEQPANTLESRFSLSNVAIISGILPKSFTPPSSWTDKTGLIIGHGETTIHVKTDGIELETSGGGALEQSVLGETLKSWLAAHTHPANGSPPTQAGTLGTILSPEVKNN